MDYKITLPRKWTIGKHSYRQGTYRVPEDMPEWAAERALQNVGATKIEDDSPWPPRPKRKRKKSPAPENKAVAAPEEKSLAMSADEAALLEYSATSFAEPEAEQDADLPETD